MGRLYHHSKGHSNKRERLDSNAKWKAKKRLITAVAWTIGVSLIGGGIYMMIAEGGTLRRIMGGVSFLAGALLIGFSWELRKWILLKW